MRRTSIDAGRMPASKTSVNSLSSRRARARAPRPGETSARSAPRGTAAMSPSAALVASAACRRPRTRGSRRGPPPAGARLRMFSATSPNSPNANSENAMVVTLSALRSGARRNASSASRSASVTACRPVRRRVRRNRTRSGPRLSSIVRHSARRTRSRSCVAITHGGARGVDVAQQLEDAARGALVEVAGGLVGDQHHRIVDQRAGDRDPLLLAAGEFARERRRLGGEPDLREQARSPWARWIRRRRP